MENKQLATPKHQNFRAPLCDISEFADRFEVYLDMPGVEEENLDVTFQNGILNIAGHVNTQSCESCNSYKREYMSADFKREFSLSEQNIAVDKICASLSDGELTLTLPKSEKVKPRKISVKSIN